MLTDMVDLHTHTSASDGQYAPAALAEKMSELNISVWAVTDHDTVAGLSEAKRAAAERGIVFVPGIELNIERPGCEFHLLGLGLQTVAPALSESIRQLQESRIARNREIIRRMNEDGFSVTLEELTRDFPADSLGRPHIAKWLVDNKVVRHVQDAFEKYLARGKPWHIERVGADLDTAVRAIYDSGGLPVIAHPLSLYLSWPKLEEALADFKARGVAGLEAYHPGARPIDGEKLEALARKLGFFITAGSDFHGELVRKDRKPGRASGGMKIEDRFWTDELKPELEKQGWTF